MEDCRIRRSEFIGVPPVYTGVVFLLSWIYLFFYAQTAGIEAAAPVSLMSGPYLVSALVMSLTLLAISFAPFGRVEFLTASFAKIAAPFSMVVGTVVLMADPPSYLAVVFIWVGGILTGVGSGVMAQQWIVAYRRVGLGVALGSFPTLMAMSVGVCVTLMYLPGNALRVATVVSPVVSGVLFHLVRLEPWPRDELECSSKDRPLNYLTLLFPIAVFYMSSGFLDFFSSSSGYTYVFYALVAFVPIVVSGVAVFRMERSGFVSAFVVPVCFLVAVLVPYTVLGDAAPLAQFISIGELGVEVMLFIVAVGFAEFFSLDALRVSALMRVVGTLLNSAGWYVASRVSFAYGVLLNSQASLFVVLVGVEVLAVALSVAIVKVQKVQKDVRPSEASGWEDQVVCANWLGSTGSDTRDEINPDPSLELASHDGISSNRKDGEVVCSDEMTLEEKCDVVASSFSLSRREVDVFRLLARGCSSAFIQSELYIAAGTVNYHTRNIYAKLGVHSRQQLIDLVKRFD